MTLKLNDPSTLIEATTESEDLPLSAIKGNEARADFSNNGFWTRFQRAFFSVKVSNLMALVIVKEPLQLHLSPTKNRRSDYTMREYNRSKEILSRR